MTAGTKPDVAEALQELRSRRTICDGGNGNVYDVADDACENAVSIIETLRERSRMAERYVTPCELPNDHERELLTILIEECAEVQQRATKLLRFGALEIQPGQEKTNSQRLALEIGDLVHMMTLLDQSGLVHNDDVCAGMRNKQKQLATFMQTAARTQPEKR